MTAPEASNGAKRMSDTGLSSLGLKAKDFKTDQEVRWCPGCGDYAVLAAVQGFMPELNIPREDIVFISGIGCSSRFPYYMNTYGMHSIHGRAPAIATGLSTSRPDLKVFVVTGDGDALSIGGNHLIHALRRNVNLTILLFNNRIYGLTKGQYSPTSEQGKITKSTPMGSLDNPFNPVSLALGAEATFVGRTLDSDRKHLTGVLRAATEHEGTSLVEIYQNCNIFNDGAFDLLKDADTRGDWIIPLNHGEEIRFGNGTEAGGSKAVIRDPASGALSVADNVATGDSRVVVHDAHSQDPSYAFAISRLSQADSRLSPMGIFRDVQRPSYDRLLNDQLDTARAAAESSGQGTDQAALQSLLRGKDTWAVG
jgi:2-oxoglutarate ferredoxin oxidoreductase subunit beta